MSRRALLACALAFALVLPARAATAAPSDDPSTEARQQYQQGTKAFSAKKYSDAALHFEAAAALKPSGIALYTAALAWDLANRPERAADAYARALDVGGLDDKQTNTAKDRISALEQTLGTLVVVAPSDWRIQLDSFTEVPANNAKLHGSAGDHKLTIRETGKKVEHRDITLDAGKQTPLELKDEPKPEPKPEETPAPPKPEPKPAEQLPPRLRNQFWNTPRALGVGVAGVGVATLVATAILGTNANSAADAYKAGPTQAAFDHASSLQTWTNVTLVAGLVFLAGGVALVALPIGVDKSDRSVGTMKLTPNGIGGTF